MEMKIEKSNDDLYVVLPKEFVTQLGWGHGDVLDGELVGDTVKHARVMTAHDHAMQIAREAMEEYRGAFEALAKS